MALLERLAAVLGAALATLRPCPLCGASPASAAGVCAACAEALRREAVDGPGAYGGRLGRAVRLLKYGRVTVLAEPLAEALAARLRAATAAGAQAAPELVTSVPSDRARRRRRGYDHAALLARGVARRLGLPYQSLLRRTRASPPQASLPRRERLANARGAFAALPGAGALVRGRTVLLVDDVWTSGATARSCERVLREAGARSVRIEVLARARPGPP